MIPQHCIDKVPEVFQSPSPLQKSIKELWGIIINGMCVSSLQCLNSEYILSLYIVISELYTSISCVLRTDQMLKKLLQRSAVVCIRT